MLEALRADVFAANLRLPALGLVKLTWGNVSGRDPVSGLVVIKPSGVPYESMTDADLVVVDLDGEVREGSLRPSSDTPSHLALYRAFPELGGVVHTHSTYATAFAQARHAIPLLGTTHADLAPIDIPLTRDLTPEEIRDSYEASTGDILIECIRSFDLTRVPAALVPGHGVFSWGADAADAVERALTVEEVAKLALFTRLVDPAAPLLDAVVRDKHYTRKHGPASYYGQESSGHSTH